MSQISQLVFYVPGAIAFVLGLVAAGWLYPQRRAVSLLLGAGIGCQAVAASMSYALGFWFASLMQDGGSSVSEYAVVSSIVGLVGSLLRAFGLLLVVGSTIAAVTGWGEPGGAREAGAAAGGDPTGPA